MRVTQSMLTTSFLRNLSDSYERLANYQNQLSTGKKINRPSDDPVVAMSAMGYHSDLNQIKQYQRNLSTAFKWMDSTGDALSEASSVLQQVYERTVQASNGTYNDKQLGDVGKVVDQLTKQMVTIANSKVGDEYIFNGTETKTDTQPYDLSKGPSFSFNTNKVMIEVNNGVKIQVNTDPSSVFGQSLFKNLTGLRDALESGASPDEISSYISKIKGNMDNLVSARAALGARENRMDLVKNRLDSQNTIATKILSDNEDADLSKVIINLKTQESVHRAALATGAKIMQPTLLDFLR